MPILTVIVGSIRPGRAGPPIPGCFIDGARAHGGFDVEVAALAEIRLPLMEEPNHPRLRRYNLAHTEGWSARIARADAIVFVTPEYNYGYPATIKNAIDYLHQEWKDKPAGFVSYGGIAAGTREVARREPHIPTRNRGGEPGGPAAQAGHHHAEDGPGLREREHPVPHPVHPRRPVPRQRRAGAGRARHARCTAAA